MSEAWWTTLKDKTPKRFLNSDCHTLKDPTLDILNRYTSYDPTQGDRIKVYESDLPIPSNTSTDSDFKSNLALADNSDRPAPPQSRVHSLVLGWFPMGYLPTRPSSRSPGDGSPNTNNRARVTSKQISQTR